MVTQREKLLIVDDEVAIRNLLRYKLSKEGYQCEEADSAEQTLDKLRSNQTDLVILDIKMPGRSGAEILSDIKADYPHTAVIMATAVTEASIAIECMKQGADDYVCKPFNLKDVANSVIKALDKRRLQLRNKEGTVKKIV
jgi:putative two-component system response regulator